MIFPVKLWGRNYISQHAVCHGLRWELQLPACSGALGCSHFWGEGQGGCAAIGGHRIPDLVKVGPGARTWGFCSGRGRSGLGVRVPGVSLLGAARGWSLDSWFLLCLREGLGPPLPGLSSLLLGGRVLRHHFHLGQRGKRLRAWMPGF